MIYKVFSDDQFSEASTQLAATLASMPTKALAFTKQALNNSLFSNLQDQLKTEDNLQQSAAATYDFKEGVQAFLEKRRPIFKGN